MNGTDFPQVCRLDLMQQFIGLGRSSSSSSSSSRTECFFFIGFEFEHPLI